MMLAGKYGAERIVSQGDRDAGFELNGHRPDILLLDKQGQAEAIFEIETVHSVATPQSHKRWIAFCDLDLPLYLVIPTESKAQTNLVIRSFGLESYIGNLLLY